MGDSDGVWGELAARDNGAADVWDKCDPLPEPGENPALDSFVERKQLSYGALVRIGARLLDYTVLAFGGPGYLKFRDIVTDRRWSYHDSDWSKMRIVRAAEPSTTIVLAEGESDGARLSDAYPIDVGIMPAGAEYFPDSYGEQLHDYELVLVGLDTDTAGERGAAKILEAIPQALRFAPAANDWCTTPADELPALPSPADLPARAETALLVSARDLLELEAPEIVSYFEQAILPVGGSLILHGWAKSMKSFIAYDMSASLAQCQDWATFEPTEEPVKVAVMQYEIPWAFYQQRVAKLAATAREPELFGENFLTWTPLTRPRFIAGNIKQEDELLSELVISGVSVFVLDPVRRATGVADLNSEKEVRPLLHFFERVQAQGISVVTLHHDSKATGGGEARAMTGSGAFAGDFDTIISVSVPKGKTEDDPERNMHFTLRNGPAPSTRGVQLQPDGTLLYSTEPYGDWNEGGEGEPGI